MAPTALYISAHAPSRFARQAGQKTAQRFLEELRKSHSVDTIILCNATPSEIENATNCESLIRVMSFGKLRKALSVFVGAFFGVPPRFATRVEPRLARYLTALIEMRGYDLVWFEFSQAAWLLPFVRSNQDRKARTVLSLHDIQSELIQRKPWLERALFGRWTSAYERGLIRMADTVRVQSTKDRDLVQRLGGEAVVAEVATPAISEFVYKVARRPELVLPHSLLFWGAMDRSENFSAAIWFARNGLPRIVERFPDAKLFVVGSNPPQQLRSMNSERILVTGFVDDPSCYFEQASLGIVPLMEGAGVKVKTLEMLAAGLKVISTQIGAEGIQESNELVVVEMEKMSEAIICEWVGQE